MTEGLVGSRGTVTVAIRPPRPGKVVVACDGGSQTFIAFSDEEVPRYTSIVVFDVRPGGVEVTKVE